MRRHRHLIAVGKNQVGMLRELLDEGENVIPAPAVEAHDVLAQLVKYLVHLECREDRLDQHRDLDGAARQTQVVLRVPQHLGPQARLEMALELWKIEIWPRSPSDELRGVVE